MIALTRQDTMVTGISLLCLFPIGAYAQSRVIAPQEELHARAFNVVRVTFPTEGRVAGIGVSLSRDGERFESTNAGLPRPGRLFTSSATMDGTTTVLLVAVGSFEMGRSGFVFDTPGSYYFRWEIRFDNQDLPIRTIEQEIEVASPTPADMAFIEGLGAPDLSRAMFGADFFERQTGNAIERFADPEARAVKVIGRLLYATRENWAGDIMREAGPRGDIHKAGEMLLTLAKEIPKSSYAPYATYYAGCCYASIASNRITESIRAGKRDRESFRDAQTRLLIPLVKGDADAATSAEAFKVASDYGDDYLKPRALYQQSLFSASVGAFDDAEKLLTEALQVAPGEGTIQEWTDKARKGADQLRAELEKGEERVSATEEPGESE